MSATPIESALKGIVTEAIESYFSNRKHQSVTRPDGRDYLSVPADVMGDESDWTESDKSWGWRFGAYELWDIEDVCQYLGRCDPKTIGRLVEKRRLRRGKTSTTGGHCKYCSRSVAIYAASLEV
jgi:hypothetical protein